MLHIQTTQTPCTWSPYSIPTASVAVVCTVASWISAGALSQPAACLCRLQVSDDSEDEVEAARKRAMAMAKRKKKGAMTEEEKEKEAEAASAKKAQEWLDTGFGFNNVSLPAAPPLPCPLLLAALMLKAVSKLSGADEKIQSEACIIR